MNPDSKYNTPFMRYKPLKRVLSTVQKVEIQRRRWEGESVRDLAKEYNVSPSTISRCPAWDGKL